MEAGQFALAGRGRVGRGVANPPYRRGRMVVFHHESRCGMFHVGGGEPTASAVRRVGVPDVLRVPPP
eukprot:10909977-Lingulodinium_polyedra.AAC.1